MSSQENAKYFDLYTTGIGYLNRVREVTPKEGSPFSSVTIAALPEFVASGAVPPDEPVDDASVIAGGVAGSAAASVAGAPGSGGVCAAPSFMACCSALSRSDSARMAR